MCLCNYVIHYIINKVSPKRDVTVLARRAVLATHAPSLAAADRPCAGSITDDHR